MIVALDVSFKQNLGRSCLLVFAGLFFVGVVEFVAHY